VREDGESADVSAPALRASDADREELVSALGEHLVAGRLTLDEFSERVDAAHAARTVGELEALRRDLPGTAAATVARRKPTHWSVAVMSGVERTSRWRVSEQTVAVAFMGGCVLDLRAAEIDSSEIEITAVAVMGGIDIIVPEGLDVDVTGLAVMGGRDVRLKDVPPVPGSPRVRVRAFAFMGGVTVESKPRSRSARAIVEQPRTRGRQLTREG
jgi:hypothetical protein